MFMRAVHRTDALLLVSLQYYFLGAVPCSPACVCVYPRHSADELKDDERRSGACTSGDEHRLGPVSSWAGVRCDGQLLLSPLAVCSHNSTRTYPTTMCALLLRLPFDVLEYVVETLDRRDLLSLALSCSAWKDIIIPRHLEYREISLSVDHHSIWKHLAERPNLAANVRRLVISDSEFCHSVLSFPVISCFRWQIPTTLVPPWSDSPFPRVQQQDYPLMALRNMRLLKTLEFDNVSRWSQGSPDTLSQFLAHVPSIEQLIVKSSRSRGAVVEGNPEDAQVSTSTIQGRLYLIRRSIAGGLGAPEPQVGHVDRNALG